MMHLVLFIIALLLVFSVPLTTYFVGSYKYRKEYIAHHKKKDIIRRKARIIKLEKELGLDVTEELTDDEKRALLIVEVWK